MDIDEMAINTHEYPSLDYQLNVCLVNLAREITDEDFHIMKYLLTVNGYKFVKFHVAGTERSNRSALEAIRAAASTNVNEKSAPGFQMNLAQQYYFKKNAALQKQLEQYQLNEIKAEFKLPAVLFASLTSVAVFLFNIAQTKMKTFVDTIPVHGALTYFRHSLEKAKELGYDVNVIQSLLEAQSIVIRKQNVRSYELLIQQQAFHIKFVEHSNSVLAYQRDKLKLFLGLSMHEPVLSTNDEFLLHAMDKYLPKVHEKHKQPGDEVMDLVLPYLEEACRYLREDDKTRLKRAFKIDQNEEKIFNRKEHSFIEGLLKVESQRNGFVDLDILKQKVVSAVNKHDKSEFETRWQSQIHKFLLAYDQQQQRSQSQKPENLTTKTTDVSKMSAPDVDSSNKMDQALDKIDLLANRLAYIEQRFLNIK